MIRAHLGQSAGSSTWLLALVAATACGIDEDQFTIAVCESEQWRDRYFVVEHVRPAMDVASSQESVGPTAAQNP